MKRNRKQTLKLSKRILSKKVEDHCERNDYDVFELKDHTNFNPSQDMIPSLIESIRFWESQKPKGNPNDWNKLKWTLFYQIKAKIAICRDLLGKADSNFWVDFLNNQNDKF